MEQSKTTDASGGGVDWDELNRLFSRIPDGPWHDIRSTGGHEIRQIDTDPDNKHHWPFRLCQSIPGQRAECDDAVFAFIADVLNAWPQIACQSSDLDAEDTAEIDRILALSRDEVRAELVAEGHDPDEMIRKERLGLDGLLRLAADRERWRSEAGSWRRVAERLEEEKAALASAPPAPTPEAGSDLAKQEGIVAWLIERSAAALDDAEAHPEGSGNRAFYSAQAIAYENALSAALSADRDLGPSLQKDLQKGPETPPPTEDLAGQGEKALGYSAGDILRIIEDRLARGAVPGHNFPVEWWPVVAATMRGSLAPAPSRPADREEIARAIHPEAFLAGSPDYYGPDDSLLWNSAAQRVALKKADAVLALRDAPRDGGDGPFATGARVRKVKGSSWHGRICGFYSTSLTPEGVCVESEREPGSVQIYPISALEPVPPSPNAGDETQDRHGGGR